MHSPVPVGFLPAARFGELVELNYIVVAQFGINLKIPMIHRVQQCLAQRDRDLYERGFIAESHARDIFLNVTDEWCDE